MSRDGRKRYPHPKNGDILPRGPLGLEKYSGLIAVGYGINGAAANRRHYEFIMQELLLSWYRPGVIRRHRGWLSRRRTAGST